MPINKKQRAPRATVRGVVKDILAGGDIVVELAGRKAPLLCDFLQAASTNQLQLRTGDRVLVAPGARRLDKGCVLGRIGPYRAPETNHVVVGADEELTLRCGEGAIVIRKNGQILLRGLDIVSHARRSNRVRGGSINLN